jgi:hypothetical protein
MLWCSSSVTDRSSTPPEQRKGIGSREGGDLTTGREGRCSELIRCWGRRDCALLLPDPPQQAPLPNRLRPTAAGRWGESGVLHGRLHRRVPRLKRPTSTTSSPAPSPTRARLTRTIRPATHQTPPRRLLLCPARQDRLDHDAASCLLGGEATPVRRWSARLLGDDS